MKFATVFAILLASATAFQAPMFATRAVGKAPATKAVAKAAPKKKSIFAKKAAPAPKAAPKKKAAVKKVAVKKVAVKKAAPKKSLVGAKASKPPPASKGYPSFAAKAQNFKLGKGKISGGAAGKIITPVFVHPTINNEPAPAFDYKEAAKARKTPQTQETIFDDGLTVIERQQKKTIPAFLTGSARSRVEAEPEREDIELQIYPFGLSADRFQLLFITLFSLFTLVGCLSGTVQLD